MFLVKVILLAPLVLGFPDLRVKWSSPKAEAIDVAVSQEDPMLETCVKSGFELRYRFEAQMCRRRTLWFSDCKDKRIEYHSLEFDPISESYKFTLDRWDDGVEADTVSLPATEDVASKMSSIESMPLEFLGENDTEFVTQPRTFITVKVSSECKGEYNRTLSQLSRLLTLGLIKISGFDSGWTDFEVRP